MYIVQMFLLFVGLIKCQEECNRNKGTMANICCEHQFPYSVIPPPFSNSLLSLSPSVCSICVPSMHWLGQQCKLLPLLFSQS